MQRGWHHWLPIAQREIHSNMHAHFAAAEDVIEERSSLLDFDVGDPHFGFGILRLDVAALLLARLLLDPLKRGDVAVEHLVFARITELENLYHHFLVWPVVSDGVGV